jgi:glycosyltransferase involved in cell wall biosynthesis
MNKPAISIVIPCYNEENNLKRGVLNEIIDFLKTVSFNWEVIICNDASTDNSLSIASDFVRHNPGFSVIDLPHGGKPSAVWGGIQKAKYPLVLFTDMDQSTPLKEVLKLFPYFPEYDIVIGSRGVIRQGNSLVRKIGGPLFLTFRRLILLPGIIDTQCGFKMLTTSVARKIFPRLEYFSDKSAKSGWRVSSFDVELLFMAQKWGFKIKEVTVDWRNEDTSNTKGDSNDRYKKESIQMLKEIIRVKTNDLKGKYATPKN